MSTQSTPMVGILSRDLRECDSNGIPRATRRIRRTDDGLPTRRPSVYGTMEPYSDGESEFLLAMQRHKTQHNRPAPTETEIYEVLTKLGYQRVPSHSRDADLRFFVAKLHEYKRRMRRPFPAWSEVYELVGIIGFKRCVEERP